MENRETREWRILKSRELHILYTSQISLKIILKKTEKNLGWAQVKDRERQTPEISLLRYRKEAPQGLDREVTLKPHENHGFNSRRMDRGIVRAAPMEAER